MGQSGGVFVIREYRLRNHLLPEGWRAAGPQVGWESDLFFSLMESREPEPAA